MSKLSLLIDPHTFINFNYFITLIKRYKWTNIFVALVVVSTVWLNYFTQDSIKLRELSFVTVSEESTPNSGFGLLVGVGDSGKKVNLKELRRITGSWEFLDVLVEELVGHTNFEKFILLDEDENKITGKELLLKCDSNAACMKKSLTTNISKLFKIIKNTKTPGFTLKVHSTNEITSLILEKKIVYLMQKNRYDNLVKAANAKSSALKKIIEKKQEQLTLMNVEDITHAIAVFHNKVLRLEGSTRKIEHIRDREKSNLILLEDKLSVISLEDNSKVRSFSRLQMESSKQLDGNIVQLRENIELLKLNNLNGENSEIINKIEFQITQRKKELIALGKTKRGLASFEVTKKNRDELIPKLRMEKKVSLKNIEKLDLEIVDLLIKRDAALKSKMSFKLKLALIQPKIAILAQMRKQYSINIARSSTIMNDFQFEKIRPDSEILKEHSLVKMFVLTIIFTFLIGMLFTLMRFFFDQKVYTADEVESICPGLTVLGDAAKVAI